MTVQAAAVAWPLVQVAAAATTAWLLALWYGDHDDPFFAPIAAIVALSQPLGERGPAALRLVMGVVVGIISAELIIGAFGGGLGRLAIATFIAMAVATALKAPRMVISQAGVSATLTVAVADGQIAADRLLDALTGAGVALVFSQLLFSPEPVRLLRAAEQVVLERMSEGLRTTATALRVDDEILAQQAIDRLRDMRDDLSELSRTRKASHRVARHSVIWWSRAAPLVRERENAGHLDLLAGSCVVLVRTATQASAHARTVLAPSVEALADAVTDLADDPGSREVRQTAVDRTMEVVRGLGAGAHHDDDFAMALTSLRLVATDLMAFAGVDADEARAAVDAGTGRFEVVAPPAIPRHPFEVRPEPPEPSE